MRIELKTLRLHNFKGVKENTFEFGFGKNTISGANGTGKTTIADAWLWLLTGKNFADQTDSGRGSFQVMTTDNDGNIIKDIDHKVEAVIFKDGEEITLGRSISQIWETINGEEKPTLKGNTTKYFYNGAEIKKTKFQELCNFVTETFRLYSVPGAFMALDWKAQREMLLTFAGEVTLESQAETDQDKDIIKTILNIGFDAWKKDVTNRKKAVKTELATIPGKIETANNLKPEPKDWAEIENQIKAIESKAANGFSPVQEKIKELNRKKAELLNEYQNATTRVQSEMFALRKKITDYENAQKEANTAHELHRQKITNEKNELIAEIADLQKKRDDLRIKFKAKEAEQYEGKETHEFKCPLAAEIMCNHPILLANSKEAQAKAMQLFYENKENELSNINATGKSYNSKIDMNEAKIKAIERLLREPPKPEPQFVKEIEEIKNQILELNSKAPKEPDTTAIDNEIQGGLKDSEFEKIQNEENIKKLRELNAQLADRKAIEKAEAEISRIEARQKELQAQLGEIEAEEYAGDRLKKKQMAKIEREVNANFQTIEFKLFEKQINGGEADTCQLFVNGVIYGRGLNKAAEVNAQLEVIDFLQSSADFRTPVFIDNTESVNELREIPTQILALKVTNEPIISVYF